MNDELRRARDRYRVTQGAVAIELGISRASYVLHEVHHVPLPRGLTPADAIDAINRLGAAATQPKAS